MSIFVSAVLCTTIGLFLGLPWYICAALTALGTTLYLAARKSSDPYGSFHISLNVTDPNDQSSPATEWLNMGYWKNANSFPEACEALALKVIEAAACKPGGRVLDVGHGSGDSLLLQLQHPAVPRPSALVGITSLQEHHERSLIRVNHVKSGSHDAVSVVLYHGDAVYRPGGSSGKLDHPLDPSTSDPTDEYTSIIAVDCAYHFRTRSDFLRQAFAKLAPGGRIALADMCFESDTGWNSGREIIAFLGVISRENIVTKDEYVRGMESMGYVNVHLEDISADVFPGFARFLSGRGIMWGIFSRAVVLFSTSGARFVVVSGQKPV